MTKSVMIVDDEESIVDLVKAVLETEGYEVISAKDGEECLEKLEENSPDLILLDMMMPEMSGRDVLKKIRENPDTENINVAFLTVARFSEAGEEELEDLGISDYITKPFDNDVLVDRVESIVGGS